MHLILPSNSSVTAWRRGVRCRKSWSPCGIMISQISRLHLRCSPGSGARDLGYSKSRWCKASWRINVAHIDQVLDEPTVGVFPPSAFSHREWFLHVAPKKFGPRDRRIRLHHPRPHSRALAARSSVIAHDPSAPCHHNIQHCHAVNHFPTIRSAGRSMSRGKGTGPAMAQSIGSPTPCPFFCW